MLERAGTEIELAGETMAYIWTHTPSLQRSLRRSNSCGELASGHHEHLGVEVGGEGRRKGAGEEIGEGVRGSGGAGGWRKGSGSGGGWGKGSGSGGGWVNGRRGGGIAEAAEAADPAAAGVRGWGRKGGVWGGFFSGQLGQTPGGFWGGDEQQQRRGGGEEEDSDDSDDFLPPGFSAPLVYSAYEGRAPYLPEPPLDAREALEDREHGTAQASSVRSSANHSTATRGQGSSFSNISSTSPSSSSSSSSSSSQPSFRPYGMPPQRAAGRHNNKPCSQPSRSDIQEQSSRSDIRKPSRADTQKPPPADIQRRLVSISDPRDLPFRAPVAASVTTLPSFADYRAKLALEKGGGAGGVGVGGAGGSGEGVKGLEGLVGRKRGKGRGLRREGSGECEKGRVGRGDKGKVEKQMGDKEKGGMENGATGKGDMRKGDKGKVGERRRHHVRSFLLPETVSEHAEGESGGVEPSAYEASREQAEGEKSGMEAEAAIGASREQAEGASSGEEEEGATADALQGRSGPSDCLGGEAQSEAATETLQGHLSILPLITPLLSLISPRSPPHFPLFSPSFPPVLPLISPPSPPHFPPLSPSFPPLLPLISPPSPPHFPPLSLSSTPLLPFISALAPSQPPPSLTIIPPPAPPHFPPFSPTCSPMSRLGHKQRFDAARREW
ncbi:unnamed protein product [Closterium sp. Naga37s-1]|nr:unnamed protein product [Closterium sp. Naga37s-1]